MSKKRLKRRKIKGFNDFDLKKPKNAQEGGIKIIVILVILFNHSNKKTMAGNKENETKKNQKNNRQKLFA